MRFRFGRWAMAATVMVAVGMVSGSAKSAERADASVHAPSSSQKRVLQGPKESKRYVLHLHHLQLGRLHLCEEMFGRPARLIRLLPRFDKLGDLEA